MTNLSSKVVALTRVEQTARDLREARQRHEFELASARRAGATWAEIGRAAGLSSSRVAAIVRDGK